MRKRGSVFGTFGLNIGTAEPTESVIQVAALLNNPSNALSKVYGDTIRVDRVRAEYLVEPLNLNSQSSVSVGQDFVIKCWIGRNEGHTGSMLDSTAFFLNPDGVSESTASDFIFSHENPWDIDKEVLWCEYSRNFMTVSNAELQGSVAGHSALTTLAPRHHVQQNFLAQADLAWVDAAGPIAPGGTLLPGYVGHGTVCDGVLSPFGVTKDQTDWPPFLQFGNHYRGHSLKDGKTLLFADISVGKVLRVSQFGGGGFIPTETGDIFIGVRQASQSSLTDLRVYVSYRVDFSNY